MFFLLTPHFFLLTVLVVAPALLFADEIPPGLDPLPPEVRQAVVVEAASGAVTAKLSSWERKDGPLPAGRQGWQQALPPAEAVIGRNGLAPEGEKREGDGRTPSGTFELRRAFGYEENIVTGLEYRQVTEKDFWVDDPASEFYNRWLTEDIPPSVSHEVLRRADDLYKYAVVIEYNTDPVVPGMGSAIFLHVRRGPAEPTAGCVAVPEADLAALLRWLDAGQNPVIIIKGDTDGV